MNNNLKMKELKETWQRVAFIMEHYNLNVNAFAVECGFTGSKTIWNIVNLKKNPQAATLKRIVNRFTEISYQWLRTGQGEIFQKDPVNAIFDKEEDSDKFMNREVLKRLIGHVTDLEMKVESLEYKMSKIYKES